MRLSYNDVADELLGFLFRGFDHTVAFESDDCSYLLLDPESMEVIGFQFDDFMTEVVLRRPQLLALAELAGVDDSRIEEARTRIGEERSRQAAVQSALRELLADTHVPY